MPIPYDPDETMRLIFKWRGTIWPQLMFRALFWVTLTVYVTFYIINNNYPNTLPKVDRKVISIPGALLTFMIVFFTSECYKRFSTGFNNCKRVGGAIRNITISVKANLSDEPHLQQEVVRLCNLGQHCLFSQVRHDQYQRVGGSAESERFFSLNYACDELNWCTVEEKVQLESFNCAHDAEPGSGVELWLVCVAWAHDILHKAFKDGQCTEVTMRTFSEQIFELRAAMSSIWSHFQCPMPLAYFHMLNFFCNIYLLVFSYALVFVDTWFCWISVLMYSIGILGLREVSIMMAEPFGEDDLDINVRAMTEGTFRTCMQLLTMSHTIESRSAQDMHDTWNKAVVAIGGKPFIHAQRQDKSSTEKVAATETSPLLPTAAGSSSSVPGTGSGSGNAFY